MLIISNVMMPIDDAVESLRLEIRFHLYTGNTALNS